MQKTLKIALLWLVLVLLPVPLVVILNTQLVDEPKNLIIYDCGLVAYVWWLAAICLATRPRWLANSIGLPTVYLTHGLLGVLAIILATCHKFLAFSMFPTIKLTGNIAWALELFLIIYAALFLSGWLVDRFAGWWRVKHWLETHVLDHELSMWIHRLNLVVVALIWLHVILIGRLSVPGFRLVFNLYTVVAILVYLLWQSRRLHGINRGTVVSNQPFGDQLQEMEVKLPSASTYHAGDFYFLSFHGAGISSESHPFSVASAPRSDEQTVTFLIQRLGNYTRKLSSIKAGTAVKLEGPFGKFDSLLQTKDGPIILYGLGSGVAPLFSLAAQYAGQKDIHLLWTGPEVGERRLQQRVIKLQKQGVKVNSQLHRYSEDDLAKLLSATEIKNGQVVIVGSASLVLTVERHLRHLGFSRHQLHDERLTM